MSCKAAWRRLYPGRCKRAARIVLAVALVVACGQGGAGHSVGHYPSYYPDEIRIDAVDPEAAGNGLGRRDAACLCRCCPDLCPAGAGAREVREVAWVVSGPYLRCCLDALRLGRRSLRCRARDPGACQRGESGRLRFPPLSRDALSRRLPASPGPDRSSNGRRWRWIAVGPAREGRRQGPACRDHRPGSVGIGCRWRRGRPGGRADRRSHLRRESGGQRLVGAALGEGGLVPCAPPAGAGARRRAPSGGRGGL